MRHTLKLPKLGDTAEDVVILSWHVAPGESVQAGEPLLTVETNKAEIDVPSPLAGTVESQLVGVGDEIKTGTAIATITEEP